MERCQVCGKFLSLDSRVVTIARKGFAGLQEHPFCGPQCMLQGLAEDFEQRKYRKDEGGRLRSTGKKYPLKLTGPQIKEAIRFLRGKENPLLKEVVGALSMAFVCPEMGPSLYVGSPGKKKKHHPTPADEWDDEEEEVSA